MTRESRKDDFGTMMKLTMEGRFALEAGEPSKALKLLRKKHRLVLKNFGEESVFAATSGVDLGQALLACGDYDEAAKILKWSAERYRTMDVDDQRAIRAASASAMAAYQAANYAMAEEMFRQLITDLERRGEAFDFSRAEEMDHLAQLLTRQDRFDEAEHVLHQALSIFERLSPASPASSISLSLLGRVYFNTRRYRESEAVSRRALTIFEQFSPGSVEVAKELDHMAMSLAMRAHSENRKDLAEEAATMGDRAVAIFAATLPPSHPSVSGSKMNLAKYKELSRSIGLMFPAGGSHSDGKHVKDFQDRLPDGHPQRFELLLQDAFAAAMNRDYARAQQMAQKAVDIAASSFGLQSSFAYRARSTQVQIWRRHCSFLLGEPTGILSPSEHLMMQFRAHERRGRAEDEATAPPAVEAGRLEEIRSLIRDALHVGDALIADSIEGDRVRETTETGSLWTHDDGIGDLLEILHYARVFDILSPKEACAQAFTIVQLHNATGAAFALAGTIARHDDSPDVRERRNAYRGLLLQYDSIVRGLVDGALGRAGSSKNPEYGSSPLLEIQSRISELREQLASSSGEQGGVAVLSLDDLQSLLREHEAALFQYITQRAIFIVFATAANFSLVRVEFEQGLLVEICKSVSQSATLDLRTETVPRYDLTRALWLYDLLLAPLERHLQRISHLLITPDGPLWSVAFEALFRDPDAIDLDEFAPSADANELAGGASRLLRATMLSEFGDDPSEPCRLVSRAGAWLGSRYAISILPTAVVVLSRGHDRGVPHSHRPFLGIGNPILHSASGGEALPELPETERLLDRLAILLGGDAVTDVVVREDASVEHVRELSDAGELRNRRVLCFATHAVYPSEEGDILQEPGLVLSGPDGPTVLKASDVRRLDIDADFVLLTACFTGASNGKSITAPLSGLAEAFFAAGAKCLLVSHWPVDVRATEILIQRIFSGDEREEAVAEALCRSARELRTRIDAPHFAHPAFWASFSVVGDGALALHP